MAVSVNAGIAMVMSTPVPRSCRDNKKILICSFSQQNYTLLALFRESTIPGINAAKQLVGLVSIKR